MIAAVKQFHESFYSTAAQVIPVLLLTLVFQLRLGRRRENESLGLSLQLLGLALAMAIGELSALIALYEHKNLSGFNQVPIWVALVWGIMMIAGPPIHRRWEVVHEAIPLGLSLAIQYGLLLAVVVAIALGIFGVVGEGALLTVGTVVVLLFAFVGIVLMDFGSRRGDDD